MKIHANTFAFLTCTIVAFASPGAGFAQDAPPPTSSAQATSFDFLLGSWEGVLEYLDYGDDQTLVELPTRLVCRPSGDSDALVLEFSYREPDGRAVTASERLVETEAGVYLGALWQIQSRVDDAPSGSHRLVLVQEGEDNGRPAAVQTVISVEADLLTITKLVTYEGAETPLQRHQYRLERTEVTPPPLP